MARRRERRQSWSAASVPVPVAGTSQASELVSALVREKQATIDAVRATLAATDKQLERERQLRDDLEKRMLQLVVSQAQAEAHAGHCLAVQSGQLDAERKRAHRAEAEVDRLSRHLKAKEEEVAQLQRRVQWAHLAGGDAPPPSDSPAGFATSLGCLLAKGAQWPEHRPAASAKPPVPPPATPPRAAAARLSEQQETPSQMRALKEKMLRYRRTVESTDLRSRCSLLEEECAQHVAAAETLAAANAELRERLETAEARAELGTEATDKAREREGALRRRIDDLEAALAPHVDTAPFYGAVAPRGILRLEESLLMASE